MTKYAEGTPVPASRSLDEIEQTIKRYGGVDIRIGKEDRGIMVAFRLEGVPILITQLLPAPAEFERTSKNVRRTAIQAKAAHEAEIRRRYRVLLLRLKSRFESMEAGETLEQAFLPYMLGAGGRTVEQQLAPGLAGFLATGQLPPLLPSPRD